MPRVAAGRYGEPLRATRAACASCPGICTPPPSHQGHTTLDGVPPRWESTSPVPRHGGQAAGAAGRASSAAMPATLATPTDPIVHDLATGLRTPAAHSCWKSLGALWTSPCTMGTLPSCRRVRTPTAARAPASGARNAMVGSTSRRALVEMLVCAVLAATLAVQPALGGKGTGKGHELRANHVTDVVAPPPAGNSGPGSAAPAVQVPAVSARVDVGAGAAASTRRSDRGASGGRRATPTPPAPPAGGRTRWAQGCGHRGRGRDHARSTRRRARRRARSLEARGRRARGPGGSPRAARRS